MMETTSGHSSVRSSEWTGIPGMADNFSVITSDEGHTTGLMSTEVSEVLLI